MKLGLTLGLGHRRAAPSTPIPLRVVTTLNRVLSGAESRSTHTHQAIRWPYVMGCDASSLTVSNQGWFLGQTSYSTTGGNLTIVSMSLTSPGGVVVPVTYGGLRSRTFARTDTDIKSDDIAASAFSLPQFTRGEIYWLKAIISVPTGGETIPFAALATGDVLGSQVGWYTPANTTISSTDVAGTYTVTGTALDVRTNGYRPMILGRPLVDGPSFLCLGDSIGEQTNDSASGGVFGRGFIQRAMRTSSNTNPLPCINLARSGTTAAMAIGSTLWHPYMAYAKVAIEQYGTNDLGTSASAGSATTLQGRLTTLWSTLRAGGLQSIIRTQLLPRATSTDSFATTANQTINTGWGAGGQSDLMNQWFATKLADTTINHLLSAASQRDSVDPFKWRVNGTGGFITSDGTHPTAAGHEFLAEELRLITYAL